MRNTGISPRGFFRELSEAELICVWGGVSRRNLLAILNEVELFLTECQSTRTFQRPAVPFPSDRRPSGAG